MGEAVTILSTTTGLIFIACHPCHHADLVVNDLLDVPMVVVDVPAMTCQLNVLMVKLLLDNVVPLPQAFYQLLVVGDKELDVLLVLASLLFEMVTLEMHSLS